MAKKIYVLDTNVYLTDSVCIEAFGINDLVIPLKVLDEIDKQSIPLALYNHENNEIIVREGFNIDTIHDQSVLFHELVHHMQFHNGVYERVRCTGELEELEY